MRWVQLVRAAATAVVAGMLAAGIFSTGAQAADGMKMSGWLPYWLMNTSTTDAVSNPTSSRMFHHFGSMRRWNRARPAASES